MTQLNKLNTYNHGTVCMNVMQCTMLNQTYQRNDIARVLTEGSIFILILNINTMHQLKYHYVIVINKIGYKQVHSCP